MEEEKVAKFVLGFFKSLKCDILKDKGVFIVKNVPEKFEKFYGAKSPYFLNFGSTEISGAERIVQGCKLFQSISKYLDKKGSTTLLKIDFDINPAEEISKFLSLRNCELSNVSQKYKNNFFARFSFGTNFNYLNLSEQIANDVYVHNGKVVDGDLSGYKVLEGKKEDVKIDFLERDYKLAKEDVKKKIDLKVEEISSSLEERLEEEIRKIKNHFNHRVVEISQQIERDVAKINSLREDLEKEINGEHQIIVDKIAKIKEQISELDIELGKTRKEEEMAVKDMSNRMSLNVDNKLINTTLIYYPVFSFNLFLKNDSGGGRMFSLDFDPLTRELEGVNCENCGVPLKALNLCSSGHLVCEACLVRCGECGKTFCKKCVTRSCSVCGRPLCKGCIRVCLKCGKPVCATHLRTDSVSGEERCMNCLRACMRCRGFTEEKYFGRAIDGSKVCQKCLSKENSERAVRGIFRN